MTHAQISDKPLHRAHVRLWREDVDYLRALYTDNMTEAMRSIIHSFVLAHKQKAREGIDALPALELSDDDLAALHEFDLEETAT